MSMDYDVRKKEDLGGIKIRKLITALCKILSFRECIYNNKNDIRVRPCLLPKYPELKYMETLKEIIIEGIRTLKGKTRDNTFYVWSCAPEGSLAYKLWNLHKDAYEITIMDEKIKDKDVFKPQKTKEVIPAEYAVFFRDIFRSKFKTIMYDSNNILAEWNNLNERSIDKEFDVVLEYEEMFC